MEAGFEEMSSLTNKIIPPPLAFRSALYGAPIPWIINGPTGKLSSNFVSKTIIKIPILPVFSH